MDTFTATDAKVRFGEILDIVTVGKRPINITRHGKIIATINPIKTAADYEKLQKRYLGCMPDLDLDNSRTEDLDRFNDIF